MSCSQSRCRFCGRLLDSDRRRCRSASNSAAGDPSTSLNAAECDRSTTVTQDLYQCKQVSETKFIACCDSTHGLREYNSRNRCPYWPTFAHPRWLDCEHLYARHNRR